MYTGFLNLYFKGIPIKWGQSDMFGQSINNNGFSGYANSFNDSFVSSGIETNEQAKPSSDSFTKQDSSKISPFTDRRIGNIPIISDNRSGIDRREKVRIPELSNDIHRIQTIYKDFISNSNQVNAKINGFDELIHSNKEPLQNILSTLGFFIPFRRMASVPDKVDNKDYIGTTETLAVAGLLLPEDLRDTKDAARQVIHKVLPESVQEKIQDRFPKFFDNFVSYSPKYNYKEYQTPFSFIRGSFLEKFVNKFMCNKYGYALYERDKPLLKTKFGKKIKNFLNVKEIDKEFTGRKVKKVIKDETGKYIVKEVGVYADKLEGSRIGKLICRALQRTTLFGTITLSAICLPSIIKAFTKPKNTQNKVVNGGKQTVKSTISVVSTLSGIGLIGALLAPLGPAGSAVGMAIGSILGTYISNKINKNIKTEN